MLIIGIVEKGWSPSARTQKQSDQVMKSESYLIPDNKEHRTLRSVHKDQNALTIESADTLHSYSINNNTLTQKTLSFSLP